MEIFGPKWFVSNFIDVVDFDVRSRCHFLRASSLEIHFTQVMLIALDLFFTCRGDIGLFPLTCVIMARALPAVGIVLIFRNFLELKGEGYTPATLHQSSECVTRMCLVFSESPVDRNDPVDIVTAVSAVHVSLKGADVLAALREADYWHPLDKIEVLWGWVSSVLFTTRSKDSMVESIVNWAQGHGCHRLNGSGLDNGSGFDRSIDRGCGTLVFVFSFLSVDGRRFEVRRATCWQCVGQPKAPRHSTRITRWDVWSVCHHSAKIGSSRCWCALKET